MTKDLGPPGGQDGEGRDTPDPANVEEQLSASPTPHPHRNRATRPVGEIVSEIDKLVDETRLREQAKGRPASETMGADEARTLTDEIKECLTVGAEKIAQAYDERADVALGYESWDAYCIAEFSSLRLRVPREERPELVASLRNAGLSIRAIASATGAGVGTIHREIEAGAAARALAGVSGLE